MEIDGIRDANASTSARRMVHTRNSTNAEEACCRPRRGRTVAAPHEETRVYVVSHSIVAWIHVMRSLWVALHTISFFGKARLYGKVPRSLHCHIFLADVTSGFLPKHKVRCTLWQINHQRLSSIAHRNACGSARSDWLHGVFYRGAVIVRRSWGARAIVVSLQRHAYRLARDYPRLGIYSQRSIPRAAI